MERRDFLKAAAAAPLPFIPGCSTEPQKSESVVLEVNVLAEEVTLLHPASITIAKGDTVKIVSLEESGIRRRIELLIFPKKS